MKISELYKKVQEKSKRELNDVIIIHSFADNNFPFNIYPPNKDNSKFGIKANRIVWNTEKTNEQRT